MSEQVALEQGAVIQRVRETVCALLDAGADGQAISFALAFIATEFGVYATNDLTKVLPVVLHGVVRAAAETAATNDATEPAAEGAPAGATLH